VLGSKDTQEEFYLLLSLEMLVPEDEFYRQLEKAVDLSWIRRRVCDLYSNVGRPSLDPEVFLKLQLIYYLEGLASERQLMRLVHDRLSLRRYIHYRLSEEVPDHSTLSKTRSLWGQGLLQEVFDYSVRLCQSAGMVAGLHLSGDKTIVQADASLDSMERRTVHEDPDVFIKRLYAQDQAETIPFGKGAPVVCLEQQPNYPTQLPVDEDTPIYRAPTSSSASRRSATPRSGVKDKAKAKAKHAPKLSNATHVSHTDREATLVARDDLPPLLAYKAEMWTDSRAGVITHADAATAARAEAETTLRAIERQRDVFDLVVASVALDKAYGQGHLYRQLQGEGVLAYVPHQRYVNSTSGPGLFRPADFVYDEQCQAYRCPNGCLLKYSHYKIRWPLASHVWRANPADCRVCVKRGQCTKGRCRELQLSIYQPDYEQIDIRLRGPGARLAAIARRTGPEVKFAEGKQWQGLARAKYRGLHKFKGQVLLTAAAQNIKKYIKWMWRKTKGAGQASTTELAQFLTAVLCLRQPIRLPVIRL
jgi:transposase